MAETTIYVHIGTHKTGTSAIQRFGYDNSPALAEQGFVYPRTGTYLKGHHPLTWALGVPHPLADDSVTPDELFGEIFAEVESTGATALILSSEGFEYLGSPERLRKRLEPHPTVIVVYLRRQDGYVWSTYNHHLRIPDHRFSGTIEQFYESHELSGTLDYVRLLQPWIDAFGRESVRAASYDRIVGRSGSVVDDFCEAVGIDPRGMPGREARVNPSIGVYASEALRLSNRMPLSRRAHLHVVEFLRAVSDEGSLESAFGPPPAPVSASLRKRIREDYADSNARLRALFPELGETFGRPTGGEVTTPDTAMPSREDLARELAPRFVEWSAGRERRSC